MQDIHEEDLETVVSKVRGTALMVVRGRHRGERAQMVERSKEGVAVMLVDSGEAASLGLDDVADYLGADAEHW